MPAISLTYAQSRQQFISSIVPSYASVPIDSLKPQEAVKMQKQEQCQK